MVTIWVCVDCMLAHHYPGEYEDSTGEEWCNYPDAKMGDITAGTICDRADDDFHVYESDEHSEECETISFSWNPCEGCGSKLGGARHAFTIWESGE